MEEDCDLQAVQYSAAALVSYPKAYPRQATGEYTSRPIPWAWVLYSRKDILPGAGMRHLFLQSGGSTVQLS